MTVVIVSFGGSNCDRDTKAALDYLDIPARIVREGTSFPQSCSGIILPGGFSYGDYLRAGAIASRSSLIDQLRSNVAEGTPLLGICNGAQIAAEAQLVPGAFTTNRDGRFRCEHIYLRVENATSPWTSAYNEGDVIEVPIAHGEGRYVIDRVELESLRSEDRILFRYCDVDGQVSESVNPNGSTDNIAGVLGESHKVAVMMPHPERATLPYLGATDGQEILRAFSLN